MLNPALVVFLCIVGAGVAILIGWAVTNPFHREPRVEADRELEEGQAEYRRSVRLSNQQAIADTIGRGHEFRY
jgi:hypothetical protein